MLIDCHCHFDRLQNPQAFLYENELRGNYIIGMTNTPRHFQIGFPYVKSCRFIRLALGFHPHAIEEIYSQLSLFRELISDTSYIGEVGLDFNKYFINSKSIQLESFDYICACLSGRKKIISIHSRMAEREVIEILEKYNISTPIFHWYTGPLGLIPQIIELGGYFSVNEAMTLSENGRRIISKIPLNRLLTESDAPYNRKSNIISALHNMHIDTTIIYNNFKTLLNTIR